MNQSPGNTHMGQSGCAPNVGPTIRRPDASEESRSPKRTTAITRNTGETLTIQTDESSVPHFARRTSCVSADAPSYPAFQHSGEQT